MNSRHQWFDTVLLTKRVIVLPVESSLHQAKTSIPKKVLRENQKPKTFWEHVCISRPIEAFSISLYNNAYIQIINPRGNIFYKTASLHVSKCSFIFWNVYYSSQETWLFQFLKNKYFWTTLDLLCKIKNLGKISKIPFTYTVPEFSGSTKLVFKYKKELYNPWLQSSNSSTQKKEQHSEKS